MSPNWLGRELEPLTDSLVCLYGTDGWGREGRGGEDLGASMEGGKEASYQVVPHAGSGVPLWQDVSSPFYLILSRIVYFLPVAPLRFLIL